MCENSQITHFSQDFCLAVIVNFDNKRKYLYREARWKDETVRMPSFRLNITSLLWRFVPNTKTSLSTGFRFIPNNIIWMAIQFSEWRRLYNMFQNRDGSHGLFHQVPSRFGILKVFERTNIHFFLTRLTETKQSL